MQKKLFQNLKKRITLKREEIFLNSIPISSVSSKYIFSSKRKNNFKKRVINSLSLDKFLRIRDFFLFRDEEKDESRSPEIFLAISFTNLEKQRW
jgi:hypothetical protein